MPEYRIPDQITRTEFLDALKPLFDRLGVTAEEVHADLLITSEAICFTVVAREVGDDGKIPTGHILATRPQEFAELGHAVKVGIR